MKLSVLALDYDGTAAQHDAMGPLIVTRESNPLEIEELRRWCSKGKQMDPKNWTVLSRLV